jgi:hypothetical protein
LINFRYTLFIRHRGIVNTIRIPSTTILNNSSSELLKEIRQHPRKTNVDQCPTKKGITISVFIIKLTRISSEHHKKRRIEGKYMAVRRRKKERNVVLKFLLPALR